MQQVNNLLLERYEFTEADHAYIKEKLNDPMIQAYIKTTVTEELEGELLTQLAQSKSSYDATALLVNNAFNKGLIALATKLIIRPTNQE